MACRALHPGYATTMGAPNHNPAAATTANPPHGSRVRAQDRSQRQRLFAAGPRCPASSARRGGTIPNHGLAANRHDLDPQHPPGAPVLRDNPAATRPAVMTVAEMVTLPGFAVRSTVVHPPDLKEVEGEDLRSLQGLAGSPVHPEGLDERRCPARRWGPPSGRAVPGPGAAGEGVDASGRVA